MKHIWLHCDIHVNINKTDLLGYLFSFELIPSAKSIYALKLDVS